MLKGHETIVIDFEGFRYSNKSFIIKELSVCGANFSDTILLKPPKHLSLFSDKERESFDWLTKNLHGINWNDGFYNYPFIHEYFVCLRIRFPNALVYVKGVQKQIYVSNFINNVYNLDNLDCPKVDDLDSPQIPLCYNHSNFDLQPPKEKLRHCSKIKSVLFYQWLQNWKNGNQSDLFNVVPSFECLQIDSSRQ